ncbi:MAG: hypothetical protein M1610_05410 [Nitrospirae bacterium]|nr:hypothetical protein [Nitrospirota bacterium]MCL5062456.1 hypothetical protein [Nitrospirota bacterium]MDA8340173.1 hypothetical protein [Nitrospiraceae bacterium]
MKKYILKEYGSWSVMVMAYLAGILAGGVFNLNAILSLLALSLFINSKQSFTLWIRHVDPVRSSMLFIIQIVLASLMLAGILGEEIFRLLPYILIPAAYVLLLYFAGEHAIMTEIFGFALLTFSSLIAKFVTTNMIDNRLYIAVAVFFTASVFKVKLQLKRKLPERFLMAFYIIFALLVYRVIKVPIVVLLPLIDNVIFSFTLYKIKLKATGWLEVIKGMAFLVHIALFS